MAHLEVAWGKICEVQLEDVQVSETSCSSSSSHPWRAGGTQREIQPATHSLHFHVFFQEGPSFPARPHMVPWGQAGHRDRSQKPQGMMRDPQKHPKTRRT